jgi:DNA-directed RNA polymerase subunit RPC12/RpoP
MRLIYPQLTDFKREFAMSIEATCAECSRHYTLKDELAGKKIRCKSCSGVMTVPAAKKSAKKSDDEFLLDDEILLESDDEFDDEPEYPRRTAKKSVAGKVSTAKKRKKKSGSSGNVLGSIAKIVAGVVSFIVAFVIVGNIVRVARTSTNWNPYEIPGAPGCTIDFPKAPKSKTDSAGSPVIFAEGSGFACAAMSEASNPMIDSVFLDLGANKGILETGLAVTMPQAKVQGSNVLTVNGRSVVDVTLQMDKVTIIKRAFLANGRVITLDFASGGSRNSQKDRFFNSIKISGSAAPAMSTTNSTPMSAHNPLTANVPPANAPTTNALPNNPSPAAPTVNVETPASMLVPDTPVDPNAPPNVRRSAWRYVDVPTVFEGQTSNAGVFLKKLGDNWVEQRKRASTTYWNETARTAEYVEIMRTDRSVFVRLYADRSEYRFGTETEFKSMYPGHWE